MLEPQIPADELQRLHDLHRLGVLDTPPEERFDRITRTATRTFGTAMAVISLIDAQRQWFKSRHGMDGSETPRRQSFCGHAILQEGALVIEDAQADPRFADNPAVIGPPHVRFYAGMPLHGGQGHRIGTLCVFDSAPRRFTPQDEAALADLAAWAELELNVLTVQQANALARERQERLQAVFDHAGDGIVTLSLDGLVRAINPAAARMFRLEPATIVDRPATQLVAPASQAAVQAFMEALAQRPGGTERREIQARRPDGTEFTADLAVTRMGGDDAGYTAIVRDASERKKVERMKNEFISTVSHELRTPLTSVRGSLGLLLGGAAGEIPAKARGLLEIASNSCDRLVRLINDMLDIEKIESGNVRFELAPQRLLALAQQAVAATESFARPFGVRYRLQADAVDAQVVADADRLIQVLVNLLSNAAKFSPAGGTVDVAVDWIGAPGRRVRLAVGDRGPGIPPDFRARMFSRFLQADSSDARSKSGTGLGLAISKAIVERLGGRIGFADRDGGGTEFFIELPAQAPAPSGRGTGAAVLVCEDDPDIARLVAMLLERGGFSSDVARDADEARERLANGRYQALTLDVGLPGEDGLSLLRWLRARPETAQLPVIVLSARDAPGGPGAAAFGALDWLVKPIDEPRLLAAVRTAMRGPGRRPLLLHVEDDPDLVQVVAAMLEGSCDTVQAGSLAQARAQLATRPFDLILLDIRLPDGEGCELLADLPALNAATPVVIFSGSEVAGELSAQVRNALVKSRTGPEQLLALLQRWLGDAGATPYNDNAVKAEGPA